MSTGLADRKAEAAVVRAFLDRALAEPGTLVLEGEAGIGKSTLLWEAAEVAAARGYLVLTAVGAPTEVRYAYAAVADLLARVDAGVLAELPEEQRAALDRVLLGAGDGPAGNERLVATAFLAVIRRLSSDTPVLLCIDDAQWLDMSSQVVIGFAERRLTGRVGLLITLRTGAPGAANMTWLNPGRPGSVERVRITPLTLGGVHALISARLGRTLPRPSITRIHEISGGNPFFAIELARFVAEDPGRAAFGLPDALAELVRHNIGCPDGDVAAVMLAAASAALPTVDRVSRATGISPDRVVELVESEHAGEVVEIDGSRIRFRHPLFATGVYSAAGPAARRAMHRRLADIVEEPELTARHLALAATTGDPDTVQALDAAAQATQARGAPAVAAELIELAINLGGDNPVRRLRAAEQHFRSGALGAARAHLESTLDNLPPGGLRCMALIALAAITGYDESLVAGADLLDQAIATTDNAMLQLQARLLLVPTTAMIGELEESVRHARAAVEQAEQLGIGALRSQALAVGVIVGFVHGLGVDVQALQLALELEKPDGATVAAFQAAAVAAVISAWTGELEAARSQLDVVRQRCLRSGTEIDILWVAHHATMIDLWAGRYADAAETAEDAVQRAEQMGGRHVLTEAWIGQAEVAAYTGRAQDVREITEVALRVCRATGAALLCDAVARVLGFLEVSLGDYPAAIKVLEPLLASFDPEQGTEIVVGGHLPDAVEALTALGRLDEAEPLVVALERNGARHDRPWMRAVGARGSAHLLAARGDLDAAEQAAQEALRHHERLPMPFEKARTQLLLGQVQRRRRRKQAAQASLRAALETFERLGAPLWERRARAELDRMTAAGRGADLTPAERRVAEHAAAGLSNKQIAAELFIAPKTVEMTLSSVYRKLGIRSRAALFAALNAADVQGNP
ncbi:helix-turn-helix transcriptional regulator [Mycolicibacter terrae]|uniref:helix-turn-helix transcriptional regulator n=1 Tax=Mycolicibacter terrae TaxID=1788 RepID=UPI00138FF254|nr:helix-turn-helix transcriptional regulator [Mycolicibacter terrae]